MTFKTLRVETGVEFHVPEGWEFVEIMTGSSYDFWVLLREKANVEPCSGIRPCPCKAVA